MSNDELFKYHVMLIPTTSGEASIAGFFPKQHHLKNCATRSLKLQSRLLLAGPLDSIGDFNKNAL
jgi:hypothetical protein